MCGVARYETKGERTKGERKPPSLPKNESAPHRHARLFSESFDKGMFGFLESLDNFCSSSCMHGFWFETTIEVRMTLYYYCIQDCIR